MDKFTRLRMEEEQRKRMDYRRRYLVMDMMQRAQSRVKNGYVEDDYVDDGYVE